jgi:hypothetical protein
MLIELRSRLTASGILLLTVPNGCGPFEMDQSLWKRNFLGIPALHARYVARRGGSAAAAATLNDDNPHVNCFTRMVLERVRSAAGFRIVDFKPRTFIAGSFPAIFLSPRTDGKNTDCRNIKPERRNFGYTPAALCIGVDD